MYYKCCGSLLTKYKILNDVISIHFAEKKSEEKMINEFTNQKTRMKGLGSSYYIPKPIWKKWFLVIFILDPDVSLFNLDSENL